MASPAPETVSGKESPATEAIIARYAFDEGSGSAARNDVTSQYKIIIPAFFKPPRHTILSSPREDAYMTLSYLKDIVQNILGFVPFGFLAISAIALTPRLSDRSKSMIVVFFGFAFSLSIELIQIFIPARSSSLTDISTNTLGAALGVLIFFIFR